MGLGHQMLIAICIPEAFSMIDCRVNSFPTNYCCLNGSLCRGLKWTEKGIPVPILVCESDDSILIVLGVEC